MALVTEPTLPFSADSLSLDSPTRWTGLLPLLRPSLHPVRTTKGPTIFLDPAVTSQATVQIAALSTAGRLSSAVLDTKGIAAIVPTSKGGAGVLSAEDVRHAVERSAGGVWGARGVVVVREGSPRGAVLLEPGLLEIHAADALEFDHALVLLAGATQSARASLHLTSELAKTFIETRKSVRSAFHPQIMDGKPAVAHGGKHGVVGYEVASEAVRRDVEGLLQDVGAKTDDAVYSVHYADINGLSRLEIYILAKEIADVLNSANLPCCLSHSTILDHNNPGRGYAISISPIGTHYLRAQAKSIPHQSANTATSTTTPSTNNNNKKPQITVSDAAVRARITAGCEAVIAAEPTITEYDTIVGDGDCGFTLRDGAKHVLKLIEGQDLSGAALPRTLRALVDDLEVNMGGTSGALYCIYLSSLAGALGEEASVPLALKKALENLLLYTRARLGDRTMMDALIPFVEGLAQNGGDGEKALGEAEKGVEGTKKMEAKLGRSTYLDESATQGVPDPGAYGLLVLLQGMVKGA